ncbi:MAG: Gfo/Idh/MocA family oxidoreductase [Caldilineaceae bacterium]|nr:Gfo/Idh/MocA family oxidoreductase [Caldilineaceae bacterium]
MVHVGVLGAGFMGGTHVRALAKIPGATVVGVSSQSASKAAALAQEVGAEPFDDPMALINDPRVEAVSITLPSNLHKQYAVAALNAGKHVLVEKPMGLSVAECDEMIEAARQAGRLLMVAMVLRHWPEYVALARVVRSGELGKPLSATAFRLCTAPAWSPWFSNPELTGGEVLDLHIHDLDLLNWLFGTPTRLFSRGQRGAHGGWDAALTVLDYNGVACFAEGNAMMPEGYPFTMALRVLCEKGVVEYTLRAGGEQVDSIDAGANSLLIYEPGAAPRPVEHEGGDGYYNELAAFVESVRSGQPPEQGAAEQGRLAVQTALAARQSIESGTAVAL